MTARVVTLSGRKKKRGQLFAVVRNFLFCDESACSCLRKGLGKDFRGDVLADIRNGANRARDAVALAPLDFIPGE